MFQAITNNLRTLAYAIGFITALALPVAQDFRVEGARLERPQQVCLDKQRRASNQSPEPCGGQIGINIT